MGLKKKVMLPTATAGIFGGAIKEEAESLFMMDPKLLLGGAVVIALLIKLLHLVVG